MDAEEIAGKYSMKDLRPIAKKYGVKTHCAKKIDVVRALPRRRWRSWRGTEGPEPPSDDAPGDGKRIITIRGDP